MSDIKIVGYVSEKTITLLQKGVDFIVICRTKSQDDDLVPLMRVGDHQSAIEEMQAEYSQELASRDIDPDDVIADLTTAELEAELKTRKTGSYRISNFSAAELVDDLRRAFENRDYPQFDIALKKTDEILRNSEELGI